MAYGASSLGGEEMNRDEDSSGGGGQAQKSRFHWGFSEADGLGGGGPLPEFVCDCSLKAVGRQQKRQEDEFPSLSGPEDTTWQEFWQGNLGKDEGAMRNAEDEFSICEGNGSHKTEARSLLYTPGSWLPGRPRAA